MLGDVRDAFSRRRQCQMLLAVVLHELKTHERLNISISVLVTQL